MSDKMREGFESWSGNRSDKEQYVRGPRTGMYKNPVMQKQWESWQASRESLVVELPNWHGCNHERLLNLREVEACIESLGLRVKP